MQGSKCHYLHLYIETARVSEEPKKEPIKFKPPMCLPKLKWLPWSFWDLREVLKHFDEVISEHDMIKPFFFPKIIWRL